MCRDRLTIGDVTLLCYLLYWPTAITFEGQIGVGSDIDNSKVWSRVLDVDDYHWSLHEDISAHEGTLLISFN
jgi:hypothetical protein